MSFAPGPDPALDVPRGQRINGTGQRDDDDVVRCEGVGRDASERTSPVATRPPQITPRFIFALLRVYARRLTRTRPFRYRGEGAMPRRISSRTASTRLLTPRRR